MELRTALPSAQFALVAGALAVSGGLVFAADQITEPRPSTAQLAPATPRVAASTEDWEQILAEIQVQNGVALPAQPDENAYQALIAAADSPNVTENVSRKLLVNLSNASAQGLGNDIPTQNQLVAQALSEFSYEAASHTASELYTVPSSPETLRTYGNVVITTLQSNPNANATEALRVIGLAIDQDDRAHFAQLAAIRHAYGAVIDGLLAIPTPQTLTPLHLAIVNNFERVVRSLEDMESTPEDPLRGLAGLQNYQMALDEAQRLFTTIAQQLQQDAILFSKEEAGSAWSAFLPASSI